MTYRLWTKREDKILIRYMADEDLSGASIELGRSEAACNQHYRYMGFRPGPRLTIEQRIAFAKEMRAIMKANHISQRMLADEYGCGWIYISGVLSLNGRKGLTADTAEKIRGALDRCVYMEMAAE